MPHPAVAILETALRARKLDRTLTTALPLEQPDGSGSTPSDVAALDACLRGGLPRGQLSELAGPRSSGRTTMLLQLMAAATRRGELVALIDTVDRLDVASMVMAGVDLDRVLWIRGHALALPHGAGLSDAARHGTGIDPVTAGSPVLARTLDRAVKALNLVLQAGGYGIVAIDLADVPPVMLRQLPFTTWMRVQRIVEGSDTACVLIVPEPMARSAGGLTLSLAGRATWAGFADRSRRLQGMEIRTTVISPRRRVDGELTIMAQCLASPSVAMH